MNAKAFFHQSERSRQPSRVEKNLSLNSRADQTGIMKTLDRLEEEQLEGDLSLKISETQNELLFKGG